MPNFAIQLNGQTHNLNMLSRQHLLRWGKVLTRVGARLESLDKDKSVTTAYQIEHEMRSACKQILQNYDARFTHIDLDGVSVEEMNKAIQTLWRKNQLNTSRK
ncbi:MAG TPA: hypothetical protein PLJ47_00460 [Candidatus Hydrogenedentes bacterium]|nr:hypothetical protein [Candidatus Hydrogenedentota bacterium]